MRPSASRTTRSRTPATLAHADLQPALLGHLAARPPRAVVSPSSTRPPGRLHLPASGALAAPDEQHAAAVEDDRADADARDARVLAPVAHAEAASQAGLA